MNTALDLTYLHTISEGDKEFIDDILTTFLEEVPKDMEQVKIALAAQDNIQIGKMAHKVKATLHLLGLEELKALAFKIEQTVKSDTNHVDIPTWAQDLIKYMDEVYPKIEKAL